jgi:hypothetical protein
MKKSVQLLNDSDVLKELLKIDPECGTKPKPVKMEYTKRQKPKIPEKEEIPQEEPLQTQATDEIKPDVYESFDGL